MIIMGRIRHGIELFSGSGTFSKEATKAGFNMLTVDIDMRLKPDIVSDICYLDQEVFNLNPWIIWASPPCDTFSVASISTHWSGGRKAYIPKTNKCRKAIVIIHKTIAIIDDLNPKYWFIENPRGVLRKVIDDIFMDYGITDYVRHTVTYCQYGDKRMKPTDIWTNCKTWKPRPMCKNGDKCHEYAPRGAKTGTQGQTKYERGMIPKPLCRDIIKTIDLKGVLNNVRYLHNV